jgi:hypothetical protein
MVLVKVRTRMRVSASAHVKVLAWRESVTRVAGWPKIQTLARAAGWVNSQAKTVGGVKVRATN